MSDSSSYDGRQNVRKIRLNSEGKRRAAVDRSGHARRWSSLADIVRRKVTWLWVGVSTCGALGATFLANLETVHAKIDAYWEKRAYLSSRQHPFPARLKAEDIAGWNSGRLKLALYQIDGYLGKLKNPPPWLLQCLTNEAIFPDLSASQYNPRYELSESDADQHNKKLIERRIAEIEFENKEEGDLLRINDPFIKLLARSSRQLLSSYKDSEIAVLDKQHLYLLRNAIYGKHGYKFNTAKLVKYTHRMGWTSSAANTYKTSDVSALERCNAFFLQSLHPAQELGALGRAILVRTSSPQFPPFVASSLCTCLAQLKSHVDCRRRASGTDRSEFHEFVDLIVDFTEGEQNKADWTFLSESEVEPTDADDFRPHQDRFLAAALDFNVAVQTALATRREAFVAPDKHQFGAHWGVKLTFASNTIGLLRGDPTFAREVAGKMCAVIRDSLEFAGPYIPRTVATVAAKLQVGAESLEVFETPIVFSELRRSLTREYAKFHYGLTLAEIEFIPRMIVVHRSGAGSLKEALERMQPVSRPVAGNGSRKVEVNASAHYLVDHDGIVYSLMKESEIARHVVGLDRHAIGIENVGANQHALTEAQVLSNAKLIRFLRGKHETIQWLVGNSESFAFEGSPLWEEKQPFQKVADDPGATFMAKVRARVSDLGLKEAPP